VTIPLGVQGLLIGFASSDIEKLHLKMVSIQGIPLQVAQTEAWRKFEKLSVKTDKVLFCRSLAGETSYVNMPVNCRGELGTCGVSL
jgi:hypothetical protein